MLNAILTGLLNILAGLIQIICFIPNRIIEATLPDISQQITQVTDGLSTLFSGIGWALGLLPPGILGVLTFILGVEIAKHTIFISTHTLVKVWNVLQKIKFW